MCFHESCEFNDEMVPLHPHNMRVEALDFISCPLWSDFPKHQQDDQNDENNAQHAARKISPAAAVRPCGDRSKQEQNEHD